MHRFSIVCSIVVLLGSTAAALADDDAKAAAGRALLASRGLTQFDLDANGMLDAGERAAALAARNAARMAPSAGTGTISPIRYRSLSPVGYPYSNPAFDSGGFPYSTVNAYVYPSPVVYQHSNFSGYPYASLPGSFQTSPSGGYQFSPVPNVHVMSSGFGPGVGAGAYAFPNVSGAGGVIRIGQGMAPYGP